MKKYFLILYMCLLSVNLYGLSMQNLFDALKHNPSVKLDEIDFNKAKIDEQKVTAKLYPKIRVFGKYENYSTPTGSIPVPPNTLINMVKDQTVGQPFGYNIYRLGGAFSMPIFIKSIYTLGKEAKIMRESLKAKKEINLLQNEAVLVATNASLLYLEHLFKSLNSKKDSLNETLKFVKIKVQTGRSAEAELYKIQDAISQIDIALNNILIEAQNYYAQIQSLTSIKLDKAIRMMDKKDFEQGSYKSLKSLRKKVLALNYDVEAKKENRWWPTISADGSFTRNYTKAYNNGHNLYENYSQIGVIISFALYNKESDVAIDEAHINAMKAQTQLEKEYLKLQSDTKAMIKNLKLLDKSVILYTKSIKNKLRLRDIAKVSFINGRMNMEDYLHYEDDYVAQQAKLYQIKAQQWQIKMKLAVAFGNNIEEMVQ